VALGPHGTRRAHDDREVPAQGAHVEPGRAGPLYNLVPELADTERTVMIAHDCPLNSPHGWRNWQTQRI
jgi:hypothetical protein